MSGSGLLYAAVLGAWAVFLLTRCLKTTPADRSSGVTEGTLLRRRGENEADTYSMLRPPAAEPMAGPVAKQPVAVREVEVRARPRISPATARRRRRVLGALVVAFVPLLTAHLLGLAPLWPAAVPAALFFAYLYEVRVHSKKTHLTRVQVPVAPPASGRIPAQRGTRSKPADTDLTWNPWPAFEEDEPAGPIPDIADGWEPRPVPLPTYVTAPKAPARRIDITAGRRWTERDAPRSVDIDDEPTQEFPVLTDELIAQIEAEMEQQAAAEQLAFDEADEPMIEHKRAVGE